MVRHARETPSTSRRKGRKFLLAFLLTLSLSLSHAFPFCSGIRSRIHETTSAACRRSIEKLGVIAALDFQPEMTIEHRRRPYENYHFFYVNRTYANCSDLRLPNRCFHHLLSSFKCQFFSLLHFFISCYKQKIFRGLINRS